MPLDLLYELKIAMPVIFTNLTNLCLQPILLAEGVLDGGAHKSVELKQGVVVMLLKGVVVSHSAPPFDDESG